MKLSAEPGKLYGGNAQSADTSIKKRSFKKFCTLNAQSVKNKDRKLPIIQLRQDESPVFFVTKIV